MRNPFRTSEPQAAPAPVEPDLTPQFDEPVQFDDSDKRRTGQHAEALLADPMLLAVFDALADKYRKTWESSKAGEVEVQRHAHYQFSALKDVVREIRAHLSNANYLEAQMQKRERREAAKVRVTQEP